MSRVRATHDGLPHRVYERRGKETYSIGFKRKDGTWAFRLSCPINDKNQIKRLRNEATKRALLYSETGEEILTVSQLTADWFKWQRALPTKSPNKRAESTIQENEREAKTLMEVFGDMLITEIQPHHAYSYLDKCDEVGRGPKGNKEIQLFQLILQRGVRKGLITSNPLNEVEKLPTSASTRYVKDEELELVLEVGAQKGGQLHRASLALVMGYLCVRRPGEVLSANWSMVNPEGLIWTETKTKGNQTKRNVTIHWTDQLKHVLNRVMELDGYSAYPSDGLIFRTQKGTRYTKGGWKKTMGRLMEACSIEAQARGIPFERFSLLDMRPKSVTDKLEAGHTDVQNATLHRSAKMIETVYDRRRSRSAAPAR